MKKVISVVFASALCVCLFGLAACGGGAGSSSASSSGTASSASSSVAVDPAEKFVGDWKTAAFIYQDVTVVGDFSALFGSNEANNMSISIKSDKTGSYNLFGTNASFTWELNGTDAIKIKPTGDAKTPNTADGTLDMAYKDNAISFEMSEGGVTGKVLFSKDGSYEAYKEIVLADATPITSEDKILGSWKMIGASVHGASMYGEPSAIENAIGTEVPNIVIESGGKASFAGIDGTWTIGADGATISISSSGAAISVPLKSYGNYLLADLTAFMGSEMLYLYSK